MEFKTVQNLIKHGQLPTLATDSAMRQAMVRRLTVPLEDRRVLNGRIYELGQRRMEEGNSRHEEPWQSDIVPKWACNPYILGMKPTKHEIFTFPKHKVERGIHVWEPAGGPDMLRLSLLSLRLP